MMAYAIVNKNIYKDFLDFATNDIPIDKVGTKDVNLKDTWAIFGTEKEAKEVLKIVEPKIRKESKIIEIEIDVNPDIYVK